MKPIYFLYIYLAFINLFALFITVLDKRRAVHHKWRVSEAMLLFVSAIGGGVSMYVTMHIIRHKTKKLKFMLGIPLIIVIELIAVFWVMNYVI